LNLAPPEPGSVIRYAYLWAREHQRGQEEARKIRPAVVIAVAVTERDGKTHVLVLAVTHSAPENPDDAVALPAGLRRQLGLGPDQSWVVTAEANAFVWPGPDLSLVPGRGEPTVIYGRIPKSFLRRLANSFLSNRNRQRARTVSRAD
jgi:hypothetical protein